MPADTIPSPADAPARGARTPSAPPVEAGPGSNPDPVSGGIGGANRDAPAQSEPAKAEAHARLAKAEREMSLMLGRVAALMMGSPEHRHLFLADLEWRLIPPLALRQCRLVQQAGLPVAYLSWALLDEAREQRLLGGNRRLAPADWRSGDRLWLIDLIAPGGGGEKLVQEVAGRLFPGREIKTLAARKDGSGVEVRAWKGAGGAAQTRSVE